MNWRCAVCGEWDGEHDEQPHLDLARRDSAIDNEEFDAGMVLR